MNKKDRLSYSKNKNNRADMIKWYTSIKELSYNLKDGAAETELVHFLEVYPNDIPALYEYARVLYRKSDYYNSINILKSIISMQTKESYIKASYTYLFKIYYKNNMFKEAYEIVDNIKFEDYDVSKETFKSMLKIKLNLPLTVYSDEGTYAIRQELDYNKEKAVQHIKRHCIIDEENEENLIINGEIEIEELYNNITEVLPSSKKSEIFSLSDIYFFYYPSFGYDSKNNLPCSNIIKVVTLKNTNKIITIFPAKEKPDYINRNLYPEDTKKTLRKSQINKFNDRYKGRI